MVKKPDMVDIVDVETVSKFQLGEHFCPKCTHLNSYIYPGALNVNIMDAPVDTHHIFGLQIK